MDFLNRAYSQLHDLYRSMTPGSRLVAGLLAAVALLSLGYLGAQRNSGPYVDLMHGMPIAVGQLPAMEAALAKANLKDWQVRGTSIRVPRGQKAAYIAALADAKALPPNFGDILNKANGDGNPFESNAHREQRMKIAKQAELSLAICSMPGIERAYVLYDVDNKPGFNREKLITATATVKPTGSSRLEESRVAAIRHLVAGAIAGLKPENVTVSDLLNGRTWYGDVGEDGGAKENLYISLKRTYEQDLKAKILNALGFIPNVTVELNVVLDRRQVERESVGLTPILARASVGVPASYFKKVWQERNPDGPGQPARNPDPSALDRIRAEESAKIQRHVAQLLPLAKGAAGATDLVTVTAFEDVPAQETPPPGFHHDLLSWIARSWSTLGLIGLALVCLLALRSIVRVGPAATRGAGCQPASTTAESATVPPPHWRRDSGTAAVRPLREELSELVDNDPETAANVLRNWIGQVS